MLVYHRQVRIAQLLSPQATPYDAKCLSVDAESLADVIEPGDGADLLHVYGRLPAAAVIRSFRIPYVAESEPPRSRLPWRAAPSPAAVVPREELPEAVERRFHDSNVLPLPRADACRVGSFVGSRRGVANMVDQTLARIHRFRDDIGWVRFDQPPTPEELRSLDLWVDPLVDEHDLDGFVAEAIVSGCLVVAGRSRMNEWRAAGGAAAFLVPRGDANEMAHAVLNALFKTEHSDSRRAAMRDAAARFHSGIRGRTLRDLYTKVLGR